MITTPIYIINSEGEKELLSFKKIYRSARRAGASKELGRHLAEIIKQEARPGMTTEDIYDKIRTYLQREAPSVALKLNLREALRKLGPTGFLFEKFVRAVLAKSGYEVQSNQVIRGHCAEYEIDFLAKRGQTVFIGECKYHNLPHGRSDLKVALANYARFLDLIHGRFFKRKEFQPYQLRSILVTNTKLTTQAIEYSNCVGVELLGWRYPLEGGLEYLVDSQKLYPITVLPSLPNFLLTALMNRGIILAEDLLKINLERFAAKNNIPIQPLSILINEAKVLLQ